MFIDKIYDCVYAKKLGYNHSKEYRDEINKRNEIVGTLGNLLKDEITRSLFAGYMQSCNVIVGIEQKRIFAFAFRVGFNAAMDILKKSKER
jgi:hypothetical protein